MQILNKEDRILIIIEEENDLDIAIEKINKNDFNDDLVELYFGNYSITFYIEKRNIEIYFFENKSKNPDKYSSLNLNESIFKDFEWNKRDRNENIHGILTMKKNFKTVLIDIFRISKLKCFE